MANKLNIPSIVGTNIEGIPFGMIVFLQALESAMHTVDDNVVYKDSVSVVIPPPRIRALSAQGQGFSVQGTNLASGDDYNVLVQNCKAILEDNIALRELVSQLVEQLRGTK